MTPGPRQDEPAPAEAVEGAGPGGPPAGRIFSLEGRRAPGLYLVAWLLSLGGIALWLVAALTASDLGRVVLVILGGSSLGLGLAAGAGSQIVERRDRPASRYRGPAPLLVFGVVLAWSSILSALVVGGGLIDPREPIGFLAGLLVVGGGYAVVVWIFAVRSGSLSWQDMGWPAPGDRGLRLLRDAGVAIAVMLPATLGMLIVGGLLAFLLDVEAPSVLPAPRDQAGALAVALAAAVVAPVGEELFFRGFALSAWLRDLGPRSALLRSALFFALIHISPIDFAANLGVGLAQALLVTLVILPLELVLGLLFLRHGMVGAISGHVTYNTLLLALLLVSTLAPQAGSPGPPAPGTPPPPGPADTLAGRTARIDQEPSP